MPGPVFLRDDEVTLRTVERDDLDFLQRWQNAPELRDSLGYTVPTTTDEMEQQYEEWTVEMDKGLSLLVCLDGDDEGPERIGHVALFDVAYDRGELGYWLVPDHHGEGYGTRVASLVLDHAFDTLALHRVVAKVFGYNDASQALLDSLGFAREGLFREHVFRFGEYQDEVRFGLLAHEWRERRANGD
ncbi:GNAT family N-acetyltransferase [Halomarina salina]|uniref:GNAT family N-acetyltransferase n=1 Tax=Halomarina salina TaxID=1872699 RepID=A0ABD5RNF0_9EURY|nr:GNAT family protein [Halomarina salina]